jgi:arylsulfatase A-like enzyme
MPAERRGRQPHSRRRDASAAGEAGSDRRTFLRRGLLAGAGLAAVSQGGAPALAASGRTPRHPLRAPRKAPNLLVIVVDQLRAPTFFPAPAQLPLYLPRISALRAASVSFERHYTASNDCTPSRGVLLTGLHSHQSGCLITGRSRLSPGLPTWGTLLREVGYRTTWWGKWHLNPRANASLEPWGFSGGTYPSPNGAPGQGTAVDPLIVSQFQDWFEAAGGDEPWCTTVSLVNPHDIAWWWNYTTEIPAESTPPSLSSNLPPNFETPADHAARGKPLLQRALQDTAARAFGEVPFDGPDALARWTDMMNTYVMLCGYVDEQIGNVLDTLATRPDIAAQTIVVFTSDHGEYAGAHGMRGKGASAYEEAIRVPLYVHDPRRRATAALGMPRTQLTSSADVSALLLTLATGSARWRHEPGFSHLSGRADLAAICRDPGARGRKYVVHATDEDVTEFASDPYEADAPRHVIAVRTPYGKLATYSNWPAGTMDIDTTGQERELYDYSTPQGQLEIENVAGASAIEDALQGALNHAITHELRAPLPARLRAARQAGIADYLGVEINQDAKVQAAHSTPSPG